jgi:hypothetical protein
MRILIDELGRARARRREMVQRGRRRVGRDSGRETICCPFPSSRYMYPCIEDPAGCWGGDFWTSIFTTTFHGTSTCPTNRDSYMPPNPPSTSEGRNSSVLIKITFSALSVPANDPKNLRPSVVLIRSVWRRSDLSSVSLGVGSCAGGCMIRCFV